MTLDGGKRLLLRPTFVVVGIAVLASNQFFCLCCWVGIQPVFLFVLLCWHPTSFFCLYCHRYYITHPGIGKGSRAPVYATVKCAGSPRQCESHLNAVIEAAKKEGRRSQRGLLVAKLRFVLVRWGEGVLKSVQNSRNVARLSGSHLYTVICVVHCV